MSENHVNRPPNILDRDFVRLGFIILIMASYALRLHELTRQDIWWDEARNIDVALRPFGQVATAPELDIHPPVYFWLLHGWLRLMRVAHGMEPALIAFAEKAWRRPLTATEAAELRKFEPRLMLVRILTSPAYLYRSEADIRELNALGARVRLCKGAYNEPAAVAFPAKADTDANYVKLMQMLLSEGNYPGIATHDERMIDATRDYATRQGITPDRFEFQMLYGIRRELQHTIADRGHRIRVYVPYGTEWFPYYMRRLAERPANVVFFLKSMLKR